MDEKPPFEKGQSVVLRDEDVKRYPALRGRPYKVGKVIHHKGAWRIALGGNPDCSFDAGAFRCA